MCGWETTTIIIGGITTGAVITGTTAIGTTVIIAGAGATTTAIAAGAIDKTARKKALSRESEEGFCLRMLQN